MLSVAVNICSRSNYSHEPVADTIGRWNCAVCAISTVRVRFYTWLYMRACFHVHTWTQVASIVPASRQAGWGTPVGHLRQTGDLYCNYWCIIIGVHKTMTPPWSRDSRKQPVPWKRLLQKVPYCMKPFNIKGIARALYRVHVEDVQYGQYYPINIGTLVGVN